MGDKKDTTGSGDVLKARMDAERRKVLAAEGIRLRQELEVRMVRLKAITPADLKLRSR